MSPVEIEFHVPKKADPEILRVDPGREETLELLRPNGLTVGCGLDDNSGFLEVGGPAEWVNVTKHKSGKDKTGSIQKLSGPITIRGEESVQVSSRLHDTVVTVTHRKGRPRKEVGNIPQRS